MNNSNNAYRSQVKNNCENTLSELSLSMSEFFPVEIIEKIFYDNFDNREELLTGLKYCFARKLLDSKSYTSFLTAAEINNKFINLLVLAKNRGGDKIDDFAWHELNQVADFRLPNLFSCLNMCNVRSIISVICIQARRKRLKSDPFSEKLYQLLLNLITKVSPPYDNIEINSFLREAAFDERLYELIYDYMVSSDIKVCKRSVSTAMRASNIVKGTAQKIVIHADKNDLLEGINLLKKRHLDSDNQQHFLNLDSVLKKRAAPPLQLLQHTHQQGKNHQQCHKKAL
ncbi:hypothetical protein [Erwinia amylovora]|uniref:hypothetical protein n=1 Tax=Erwinia amylovora TaxID=552 RepID=UPI0020BFDB45|nr:hypothetical protein [Erwinia amylovora]MCK8330508.1 hypothetical protein [Erwinia amylovora]